MGESQAHHQYSLYDLKAKRSCIHEITQPLETYLKCDGDCQVTLQVQTAGEGATVTGIREVQTSTKTRRSGSQYFQTFFLEDFNFKKPKL